MLPHVNTALETIESWESTEARGKATAKLNAIRNFQFIIALVVMAKVSSVLIGVSRHLQA